jgi:hypothetical protein
MSKDIFSISLRFRLKSPIVTLPATWIWNLATSRFKDAGTTYNTGNWLAIFGAIAQVVLVAHSGTEIASGLKDYFIGNLAAVEATLGTAAFFYGGRKYSQAWERGLPVDESKNRDGHFWSAVGAFLIALGLAGLSTTDCALLAAIVGGALHTGGKAGCLLDQNREKTYKYLPLLSRIPASFSLGLDLAHSAQSVILPTALIVANIVWARADVMLTPPGRANRVLDRVFCIDRLNP